MNPHDMMKHTCYSLVILKLRLLLFFIPLKLLFSQGNLVKPIGNSCVLIQ